MNPKEIIEQLKRKKWYNGQLEAVKEIPGKGPHTATLDPPLAKPISDWLKDQGIKLYTHQVEAINLIREGKNVALTTPTASGKTLAFNLPILEKLSQSKATALYLYPLKALANDQLNKLHKLCEATRIDAKPRTYDGDTPSHQRPGIRETSRIILSNPYALHQYLPWHNKWSKFFSNLEYVVLDEAHRYRGVFGSNVAMLIRRLRRILANYDSHPQWILSSATMANPEEFSSNLVGKDFTIVSKDGSEQGKKCFIFWNPLHYPENSVHRQATQLLSSLVDAGYRTLLFTISRKLSELTARWAQELTPKRISSYRAGYLPEERREIEKKLRSGELDGVASTNALELGVDIGGLDSVIISGYPGSVISTWQQAGRAGRGREDSLVALVAFENPLDQYFMKHPQEFFGRSHEHLVLDTRNPYILSGHLLCAAAELPVTGEDEQYFANLAQVLGELQEQGLVQETPMGWVYRGTGRPVATVSINDISDEIIQIKHEDKLLETMNRRRALEEAHPGAVLLHQGETYIVSNLDLKIGEAEVVKEDVDFYTQIVKQTETKITNTEEKTSFGGVNLFVGGLHVTERFPAYKIFRYDRLLQIRELDLPEVEFDTQGMWFTLPVTLKGKIGKARWRGGLHGVEHALIAMAPFYALCDRWDIGGYSTPYQLSTGKPTIFIYDGFEGGIGISEKLFTLFDKLIETTKKLVKTCECEEGCPSCIYSPTCGNNNQPLDKKATQSILEYVLGELAEQKSKNPG